MIFGYHQLWATLFIGYGRILSCSGFINSSLLHYPTKGQILREDDKGSPFLKCVVSIQTMSIRHCPNSFRPPLPLSNGQTWKKVPQTILASLYSLPLTGNTHGNNTFQKGAFLSISNKIKYTSDGLYMSYSYFSNRIFVCRSFSCFHSSEDLKIVGLEYFPAKLHVPSCFAVS